MIGGQHFSSFDRKDEFLKKTIPDFTCIGCDVGKNQADILSAVMAQFPIPQMFRKMPFFDGKSKKNIKRAPER